MNDIRLKFHWSLFLRFQLTIFQHWFRSVMAWRQPGDKPLSEPMMAVLPTHICITRPQWVNQFLHRQASRELTDGQTDAGNNNNPFGLMYDGSTFTFPTTIICKGVSVFVTCCPCGVWCHGLTTSALYVHLLFGISILNELVINLIKYRQVLFYYSMYL